MLNVISATNLPQMENVNVKFMLHENVASSLTDVDHVMQGSHSCQNIRRDFSGGDYFKVFTREARPHICLTHF